MPYTLVAQFLLLICIPALSQSAEPAVTLTGPYRKMQRYLDAATRDGLGGVAVFIQEGPSKKWVGSSGYANKESKEALEPRHIFSLASVGKMYNAVAVFKLMEEGKLKLDDPIGNYLPKEIIDNLPNASRVTIRHLLGHTSGWQNYDTDTVLNRLYLSGKLKLDTLTQLNALRRYAYGKPALAEPGSAYHYSSTNYLLLAMIMDRVTREGHTAYVRNLLSELEFSATYYRETPPRASVQYYGDPNQDGQLENLTRQTVETTNWFSGDDGIYSNAWEAARFIRLLMSDSILRKESLVLMKTGNTGIRTDTGLGLMADKSFPYGQLYGHSGRGIGTTTDVYYFPKRDLTIVILCNTGIRGSAPEFRKVYLKMRTKIVKKLFLF